MSDVSQTTQADLAQDALIKQRRALACVARDLYEGAVLEIVPVDGSAEKYLCFRLAGEEMPEMPMLSDTLQANQSGLYISGEMYQTGTPKPGNVPRERTWMGIGSLDDVLITLASFGDLERLLQAHQVQMGFRATQQVPRNRGVVRLDICDFGEFARSQWDVQVHGALRKMGCTADGAKEMMVGCKAHFDELWLEGACANSAAKRAEEKAAGEPEDLDEGYFKQRKFRR